MPENDRPPPYSPEAYDAPAPPQLPPVGSRRLGPADFSHVGLGPRVEDKLGEYLGFVGELADKTLKFLSEKAPGLETWLIEALDTIFAPRLLLRHLLAAMALQLGLITWNMATVASGRLLGRLNRKHRDLKEARAAMRDARDYEEWKLAAERLDELEGHHEWRIRPDSLLYDHEVLQSQIDELNAMMQRQDVFGLMFRLRGSLSRNQHGMLHEGLFSRAHAGTKILVENYHEAVSEALHYICAADGSGSDIPTDAKLAFFNETRHAYGRTALMLSGGAAMGFYHVGVVKALIERQLMPRVVSGASAGSIVAAMVGTRTDAELRPMYHGEGIILGFFRPLRESKRQAMSQSDKLKNEAFWQFLVPPALRWAGDLFWQLMLSSDGLLRMDTEYFRSVLRHNVGSYTFQEAFDRTGRIVNIIVAPRNRTDPPRLLNYLTAPHVLVWSAAVCSSSVPGVFDPSTLLVKESDGSIRPEYSASQKYVDGSMEADLPMQQISELFNINHFIVSQVNPHASVLSTMALSKSVWNHPLYSFLVGLVGFLKAQLRNWFRNVLEFVSLRRMAPVWATRRGGIQLLTQEYEGRHCDVTITPWEGHESVLSSFVKMLSNPSRREFSNMVTVSERNTWPKIDMIRCHCAVEMTLEQCVQTMRKQLAVEDQEQAARLAQAAQHGGNGAGNGIAEAVMRMGGRVPSFYTSRSIVNLSGLNVTDPSLMLGSSRPGFGSHASSMGDAAHSAAAAAAAAAAGGGDARDRDDGQDEEDDHDDVGLSMEVPLPYPIPLSDATEEEKAQDRQLYSHYNGSSSSPGDLGGGGGSSSSQGNNGSMGSLHAALEGGGPQSPPSGSSIVKSTSMANFYYRRSKSWDQIHGRSGSASAAGEDAEEDESNEDDGSNEPQWRVTPPTPPPRRRRRSASHGVIGEGYGGSVLKPASLARMQSDGSGSQDTSDEKQY